MTTTTAPTPNCRICTRPLTDSELDAEPGGEPGHFSAHHACSSPTRDGRYVVVPFTDGQQSRSVATAAGYEHATAATEYAGRLARTNRRRHSFRVWDRSERRYATNHLAGALA